MIKIAGREIGSNHPPYVIAELSGNHNGDKKRALHLLELAKETGVDAVKIQTYTPDTMTLNSRQPDFMVKGGLWDGKSLYELYDWAHTPWDWHGDLFAKARELDLVLFSSPFDETAVDFLEQFDVPAYKIASFEMTDHPLLEKVAATNKPIIISTGMATFDEIQESVSVLRKAGARELVVLHCVSSYPAKHDQANLRTLLDLKEKLGVDVGLSDHTLSNVTAITSIGLGACVIEKHFIDSRGNDGPDSAFSLVPNEFAQLTNEAKLAWESLGTIDYSLKGGEKESLVFRRSLYAVEDIAKGDVFTASNLRRIRPGFGAAPKFYNLMLGQKSPVDIEKGKAISQEVIMSLGL